jgi:O-methyltransferase
MGHDFAGRVSRVGEWSESASQRVGELVSQQVSERETTPMRFEQIARFAMRERRFRRVFRKYKQFTMVPRREYVGNLHLAARMERVEGCIVECGTWRGGMIAGIADVLGPARSYHLCDSFQGLPPAKEVDGPAARAWQADTSGGSYYNNCTASEEEARTAMAASGARNYTIHKGWFEDTLPKIPPEPIALLRMDGDWYESTMCILENLSDRVVPGGLIIVDDYYAWDGCAIAVNEYAAKKKWRIRECWHGVCYVNL